MSRNTQTLVIDATAQLNATGLYDVRQRRHFIFLEAQVEERKLTKIWVVIAVEKLATMAQLLGKLVFFFKFSICNLSH